MGQKVSPIGFRTGITIDWKSRWFAPKSNYGEFLVEDAKVRRFIDGRLNRQPPYAAISEIQIERTREEVKITLRTARPGLVIGPKGAEVDKLRSELEHLTDRRVSINIMEIKNPDLDAQLIAEGISEQLKRRSSFRRTIKMRAEASMQSGAKGVKITLSGRLGGAEMSRSETQIKGSIPLQTLQADVDYGFTHCRTTYGVIGVKVWVYRGMFGEEKAEEAEAPQRRPAGGGPRPPRRRGGAGGPGRPSGRARRPAPPEAAPAGPKAEPEAAKPAQQAAETPPAPAGDDAEKPS